MDDCINDNNKIITAGTGSGYAEAGRGGSALLLSAANSTILMDCGEGAAGWVNHYELAQKITAIFISHMHPDHIAGLFMLVQNLFLRGRQAPLDIYMPAEGIAPTRNMLAAMYLGTDRRQENFSLRYNPVLPGTLLQNKEFIVNAWSSDHFDKDKNTATSILRPAFGFTVNSGQRRLVYTGDVATVQCFAPELLPGTTLICEAAHIDYKTVVRLAFDKQVKRLVFIHIAPEIYHELYEYCRTCHFVSIARDGLALNW